MFLYELSIELDLKSGELAAAAASLGLGAMGPTTKLTAEHVDLLRAKAAAVVAESGPPPPPPAVAVPADWLPALDPLPAEAGPPPPLLPPLGGPGGGPHGGTPPVPAFEAVPTVDGPTTPTEAWPASPPTAPPTAAGPGLLPAMELADGAGPRPTGPHPAGGLGPGAGDSGPVPTGRQLFGGRFTVGQIGLIGTLVVAVVALFGFMVANTGPDEGRQRALAADDPPARPACAGSDAAICGDSSESGVPAATPGSSEPILDGSTTLPAWAPADVKGFCGGARATTAFDLRITAALLERDLGAIRQVITDGRAEWSLAVAQMHDGAPASARDDIALYRSQMEALFGAVDASATIDDLWGRFGEDQATLLDAASNGLHPAIGRYC